MALPRDLSREDILAALDWIDSHPDDVPTNQRVRKFALLRDSDKDEQYPPKFVIRKAHGLAHEWDWAEVFSGGTQANNFLIRKEFKIWDRSERRFVGLEPVPEDQEKIFEEGGLLVEFRKHIKAERKSSVPLHVKKLRLKKDRKLRCDVCGFSFVETYGEIGAAFIEAHHLVPLGNRRGARKVSPSDIALVCSNCHRMLHSSTTLLKLDELRLIVRKHKKQ